MPNIHHALLIGSPAEKIYTAISRQEGLAAWWSPEATAKSEVNSIARFPFGTDYFKEMRIVELKPFVQVKWICITGVDEWLGTTISFNLLPVDKDPESNSHPELADQKEQLQNEKGTMLIFHHDNWKEYTPMFAECSYTWGQFLRSLKLLCETGKGRPWPNQHRA